MESSALNTAHEKIRRAEALTREGRFGEAAECHEKVAGLLTDVHSQIAASLIDDRTSGDCANNLIPLVPSIHSLMTLESLALQRDYHNRQAKVVRMKQVQFEEYKNTLETQQRNLINKLIPKHSERDGASIVPEKFPEGSLRQAIYKTIEEQDSLLNLMKLPKEDAPDGDDAFKHPKDTGVVIEELRTINNHLRTLVGSLLSQLESKEHENRVLTERLQVMSAETNMRSDESHSKRLAPLPPLAPLEMPLFDFTSS